jgi:hypothetical protein
VVARHAADHPQHAPGKGRAEVEAHGFPGVDAALIVLADRPDQREAVDGLGEGVGAVLLDGAPRQAECLDLGLRRRIFRGDFLPLKQRHRHDQHVNGHVDHD